MRLTWTHRNTQSVIKIGKEEEEKADNKSHLEITAFPSIFIISIPHGDF